jgi:D-glycero-D-manno-heptose 1,7-bisphosphate phosphatase
MIIDLSAGVDQKRKTIFFDRDGTINLDSGYTAFPAKPILTEPFQQLISSSFPWKMVNFGIITNQSGVARNKFSLEDMFKFNSDLKNLLSESGILVQVIVICPHHPDENCTCRKPSPRMVTTASNLLGTHLSDVAFIGDTSSDSLTAQKAGVSYFDINGSHFSKSIYKWLLE